MGIWRISNRLRLSTFTMHCLYVYLAASRDSYQALSVIKFSQLITELEGLAK